MTDKVGTWSVSIVMALIGLVSDSQEAVIGSMLLSPLGSFVLNIRSNLNNCWQYLLLAGSLSLVVGVVLKYTNLSSPRGYTGLLIRRKNEKAAPGTPCVELQKRYMAFMEDIPKSILLALGNLTIGLLVCVLLNSTQSRNIVSVAGCAIAVSLLPPWCSFWMGLGYQATPVRGRGWHSRSYSVFWALIIFLTNSLPLFIDGMLEVLPVQSFSVEAS